MKTGRLILGRRPGESIQIGADILVTLLECQRGYVKIAIEAPVTIPIIRSELEIQDPADANNKMEGLIDEGVVHE